MPQQPPIQSTTDRKIVPGDIVNVPYTPSWRPIPGAVVVCANCGQVRKIAEDGTVEIVHPGGKPIDEDELPR